MSGEAIGRALDLGMAGARRCARQRKGRAGHRLSSGPRLSLWLVMLASMLVNAAAFGQQSWVQSLPTTSPSATAFAGMAFDSVRNRSVAFGGSTSGGAERSAETWEWDGNNWERKTPSSVPSARQAAAMAYDIARQRVVLFSGYSTPLVSDTWEWDGVNWSNRTPLSSPLARVDHAMAYDSARGRMVLFGGQNGPLLADTWEFDGTTWTEKKPATSPSARSTHRMAYDPGRGRVVLYGGSVDTSTWEWDGTVWTQSSPGITPGPRFVSAMAYDASRGQVVLFGGYNGSTGSSGLADTWEWNGTTWTQANLLNPPPGRFDHAMVFDALRQRLVLFGGGQTVGGQLVNLHDTWELPNPPTNRAPTVSAGPPRTVALGTEVVLAATGSDPDGDSLTYSWSRSGGSGPAVALSGSTSSTATFTTTSPGTYAFTVLVRDPKGGTGVAAVIITATSDGNPLPVTSVLGLNAGLNMVCVPLRQRGSAFTAKDLVAITGARYAVRTSAPTTAGGQFQPYLPGLGQPAWDLDGTKGYLLSVPSARTVTLTGDPWPITASQK